MTLTSSIPYARQSISQEDIEAVQQALSQPQITRGPLVEAFEKAMADYCGATYAVAFSSGTAALAAAYFAADIGPSDRVLTTPNSFVATIGPAIQRGARAIFIDIDPTTGNIDLEQLFLNMNEPMLRGKIAIVPVHFAGNPVDMQAIDAVIRDPRSVIIEDAAHAIGSQYKDGKKVGSCAYSHMTMFSFHPAKTITTGEGGMVTTNDKELYHRLQLFRNNGIEREAPYLQQEPAPGYYEVVSITGNYNFTEMQAALGLSQLKRIDAFIAKRQKLLNIYREQFADTPHIKMLMKKSNNAIAPHLCVVTIDFAARNKTRTDLMNKLQEKGIGTQVHYIPLYRHPFLGKQSTNLSEYFPGMESYYAQALSLPLYYDLTEEQVVNIANTLKQLI